MLEVQWIQEEQDADIQRLRVSRGLIDSMGFTRLHEDGAWIPTIEIG